MCAFSKGCHPFRYFGDHVGNLPSDLDALKKHMENLKEIKIADNMTARNRKLVAHFPTVHGDIILQSWKVPSYWSLNRIPMDTE